jgi:hypothetical protein
MNLPPAPELHTSLPFSVRSSRGILAFQQSQNINRGPAENTRDFVIADSLH